MIAPLRLIGPIILPPLNLPAQGSVTITGTAAPGQTLVASHDITDANGMGTITWLWAADGIAITGTSGDTLAVTQWDYGKTITATAQYMDNAAFSESVTSAPTAPVSAPNTAPVFALDPPGTVSTHLDEVADIGMKVLVQPDGKLVLASAVYSSPTAEFSLARFNADGSVDTSFNGGAASNAVMGSSISLSGAALQADGKVIVSGYATPAGGTSGEFVIARFNADGTLDSGFSGDGLASVDLTVRGDQARTLLVQDDGKIIVGGMQATTSITGGSYRDFALVRFNTDGTLDTTFGSDGIVVQSLGTTADTITGLAQLADGQFMALGNQWADGASPGNVVLARYNANGSLDAGFGIGGVLTVATTSAGASTTPATALFIQADGKLVISGQEDRGLGDSSTTPFILRLNADGTPDLAFGGDGKVSLALGPFIDNFYTVVQQDDGKLVVSGLSFYGPLTNHGVLVRFNTDGTLDEGFGDNGIVYSPYPSPSDDSFQNVSLQADGKIVVSGFRTPVAGGDRDAVLLRYNTDGTLDTTFHPADTDGNQIDYEEGAKAVVLRPGAAVYDAELSALGSYAGATLALSRSTAPDADDVFGSSGDVSIADGSVTLDGLVVGTSSNTGGTLGIVFNDAATQAIVDAVLSSITYTNEAAEAGETVVLQWTFADGNDGAQGGSLQLDATTTTQVHFTEESTPPDPITPVRGSDEMTGTAGDDVFLPGRGAHEMTGGDGDDTYVLGDRRDVVIEAGGQGMDTIVADRNYALPDNVENLTMEGRARTATGNDLDNVILGNDTRNKIEGGLGADTLTGGGDADRFIYLSVDGSPGEGGWDVITDFSSADSDRIVLRAIDADDMASGNQAFEFIGDVAFAEDASGQLRFDSNTHMLYGSTDADFHPEFAIELAGVDLLTAHAIQL